MPGRRSDGSLRAGFAVRTDSRHSKLWPERGETRSICKKAAVEKHASEGQRQNQSKGAEKAGPFADGGRGEGAGAVATIAVGDRYGVATFWAGFQWHARTI